MTVFEQRTFNLIDKIITDIISELKRFQEEIKEAFFLGATGYGQITKQKI